MQYDATASFKEELEPEERILWTGQPQQGMVLRAYDILLIPFSLLWAGFAILWESFAIIFRAPFFFALWGIPFVLAGLYVTVGRFIVDAKQREKTYYALTNKRIMILSGLFTTSMRTVKLNSVSDVTTSFRSSGKGTITFGQGVPFASWYSSFGWAGTGRYLPPCFEMIENAKQVYGLVRQAQRET